MANLVPLSKSSIVKYQKSGALKANKFFASNTKTKVNVKSVSKEAPKLLESTILKIERKVITIDKLLKDSLALKQKKAKISSKEKEDKTFAEKEKELEKTKPKPVKGVKLPSKPKLGLFEWIKNFIFNTILGYFAIRFYEHLPKLLKLLPTIIKVGETIIDFAGGILDSFVTLVDWGYKAYDATRGFLKTIGGENIAKTFDDISSKLNTFLNLALLAGMAVVGAGYKAAGSVTGKAAGAAARSGASAGARGALATLKPVLSKLPIIGGLVEFGISWALGDPVGRAAFKGIGSALLGAIGTAIGGPIGLFIGQWAGAEGGGILYDILFGNKKPTSGRKYAGGGSTRKGKPSAGRTLKKRKKARTLTVSPRKIKPGISAGGEDKIQALFPNPEKPGGMFGFLGGLFGNKKEEQKPKKSSEKVANPQEFLTRSNDVLARANFFGPFFTIALKSVLGQKPDKLDYENVGSGLNAWMQQTFKTGSLGFAGGGEVDARQFFAGEDYSKVIAKSVEDSVSSEVNDTIRNLSKELSLRPVGRDEMLRDNIGKKDEKDPLDITPGATVTGGNADFWTLVAISRMEDSDPQGSADVAQSIYNRVASGIYGAKTIKELVLRQGQYEPTWKYPRRGKTGVPNPEWHAIKDLASASQATGISQSDLQKTAAALRNSKYQEEARKFVGGRTDFMGGSNKPGPGDVRRRENAPNNFFGWFVGPAARAYGAKNPGPAKVPQLGDIVVMGGGVPGIEPLGKGYGSGGSKIAGELGRYIKKKLRQGPDFSQVHRHPEHPPYSLSSGHSRGSLHYQGRALDIGAYTYEQGPILKVISEFNRMKGVRPVQLLHGGNEPSGHGNHVHVAYARGGPTLDGAHLAMIGEEGQEYVIDADSYEQTEKVAPGLLDILNYNVKDAASLQKNMPSIVSTLSKYTNYEMPYGGESQIVEVPIEVPVEIPVPIGGGRGGGGVNSNDMFDRLAIG